MRRRGCGWIAGESGVKLYLLHMNEGLPPAVRNDWENLVGADRLERVRACRYREDAERSLCGEVLARYSLAQELGRPPSSFRFGRSPIGRPKLVSPELSEYAPHFSISHAGGLVACAVAGTPVGVDVEGKAVTEELAPWLCHEAERNVLASDPDPARLRLRLWALKESWVKCLETGVGRHMAALDLSAAVRDAHDHALSFSRSGCSFESFFVGNAAVAVCLLMERRSVRRTPPDGAQALFRAQTEL